MSILRKLLVGVSVLTLLLAGCMSHEYADKIDKAVKLQEKSNKNCQNDSGDEVKHFDKKDANIYVFDKGKYVVLEYKPLSDDAEARYYTYEFKDKKHIIIKTLMQKHTTNLMSLTTKKRICINRFRKRRNDEKINRIIDDFMYSFALWLLRSNGLSKAF